MQACYTVLTHCTVEYILLFQSEYPVPICLVGQLLVRSLINFPSCSRHLWRPEYFHVVFHLYSSKRISLFQKLWSKNFTTKPLRNSHTIFNKFKSMCLEQQLTEILTASLHPPTKHILNSQGSNNKNTKLWGFLGTQFKY